MVFEHPSTDVLTPRPPGERVSLKLRVIAGVDFGREWPVSGGTFIVGSGPDSEIQLSDRSVSGRHLSVEVRDNRVKLTDLDSKNGSFSSGARFSSLEVPVGTTFQLGRTLLKLTPRTEFGDSVKPQEEPSLGPLVGPSLAMRTVFARLALAARSDSRVLIEGESGTGKELCAQQIHAGSDRADKPFVVVDLAVSRGELLEAELFGHVAGAFTGAVTARRGAFELADGGTVFLDHLHELPLDQQPQLLRVVERGEIKPLGGGGVIPVNIRLVSASSHDLEAMVAKQQFRADLYHRLAAVVIRLPPLRDRLEDVPSLVSALLQELGAMSTTVSSAAYSQLKDYGWPGNVRELKNVLQRMLTLGGNDWAQGLKAAAPTKGSTGAPIAIHGFHQAKENVIEAFERAYLEQLLDQCQGNIRQASQLAGVNRAHMYRLLKKHGLTERAR
jgi:two-component system, NtrC family, nitrogen regulation response regulator GlnG